MEQEAAARGDAAPSGHLARAQEAHGQQALVNNTCIGVCLAKRPHKRLHRRRTCDAVEMRPNRLERHA